MRRFLVGICQINIVFNDYSKNMKKVIRFIEKAKRQGCRLVLFPELTLEGISMKKNLRTLENGQLDSKNFFEKIAIEKEIAIGFGWSENIGDKQKNHYTIIEKSGEIIYDYIKIHPFRHTTKNSKYIAGNDLFYCEIDGFNIGGVICYDLYFPEIFSKMAKCVDFIFVPALWPLSRKAIWNTLIKARAIENKLTVAGINAVGEIDGVKFAGDSMFVDFKGEACSKTYKKEKLIVQNLYKLKMNKNDRHNHTLDKREDLYKDLEVIKWKA